MTVEYPYLEEEDAKFAKAFRLSEDETLEIFGGLKGYTLHRLDRAKARGNGYEIPALPRSLESQMESLKFAEITEKQLAAQLVRDQREKVGGIMSLLKVNMEMQAAE